MKYSISSAQYNQGHWIMSAADSDGTFLLPEGQIDLDLRLDVYQQRSITPTSLCSNREHERIGESVDRGLLCLDKCNDVQFD